MAEALLDKVLEPLKEKYDATADDKAYEVLETMKGKDLEYKPYEPLYEEAARRTAQQHKKAFFVYCDDYVTMTDGTGNNDRRYRHRSYRACFR